MNDNLTHNPWRWYYGFGRAEDCERYFVATSRFHAIAEAERGSRPGDPYCVGEARYAEPNLDIFVAEDVLDQFADRNETCWSEDGPDINTTSDQDRDLEQMLNAAFAAWAEKHSHPWRVWHLEQWRNTEDRTAPSVRL